MIHIVFFSYGSLWITTNERLSEDDLAVAKRFADVFDFSFARCLYLHVKEDRTLEL